MEPVLYAQSASGSIAYQVLGGGSFDLVCPVSGRWRVL